jgi:hypothetical protein
MRLNRCLCLSSFILIACSSSERQSGPDAEWPEAVVTTPGVPTGELIIDGVDSTGVSVEAFEFGFYLYVFPGTVDTFVEIGVQDISPVVPGGVRALRLTPENLPLAHPVVLELVPPEGDSLSLSGRTIGVRLADGRWRLLDQAEVESTAGGRLRFRLDHFGDVALIDFVRLRPAVDTVNEGASLALTAEYCSTMAHLSSETVAAFAATCNQLPRPDADDDDVPLTSARLDPSTWTVNGVPGGAIDRGTITGGLTATYVAPGNLTVPNPVSVSITARGPDGVQVLTSRLHIQAGTNAPHQ